MGTRVEVSKVPPCDFCQSDGVDRRAKVDGRTVFGPWANMCSTHFRQYGVGLGTGHGQQYVLRSEGSQ